MEGLIFNIQRFSVHDGPGIRTTVFMKGCPLRCSWCANPESQKFIPQLMTRDVKCTGCGACASCCAPGAIKINGTGARRIDWDRCEQCLLCVDKCIFGALSQSGTFTSVASVFEEVMRDRLFYGNSGGGVTVSGGEPLLQSDFVATLLQMCKQEGLHTAVDTTGHVAWSSLEAVLSWTDLLLWDIKHLDTLAHEQATGVGNHRILENLARVPASVRLWLRIPLVAGFNDDEAHMAAVIALAREVNAEKISLLPYHEGGRSKSGQIGMVYQCEDAGPPAAEKIDRLEMMIAAAGINTGIGN